MSSPLKVQVLEQIIKETKDRFDEYWEQLVLSVCIWTHLKANPDIQVLVEPDITHIESGRFKRPDLVFVSENGYTVMDHKRITSTATDILQYHVEQVELYREPMSYEKKDFTPDVGMLCPFGILSEFSLLSPGVPVLGYRIDGGKTITFYRGLGTFNDPKIEAFFSKKKSAIPFDTGAVSNYRFLKTAPPLVYTATQVFSFLWNERMEFYGSTFTADKAMLLRRTRSFLPPFTKSKTGQDIVQITEGRIEKALRFLAKHGWIRMLDGEIEVDTTKGKMIPNNTEYFIQQYAVDNLAKRLRKERDKLVPRKKEYFSIDDFL